MLTVGALRDRFPEAEFRYFNSAGEKASKPWFYTPVESYEVMQQGSETIINIFVAKKKPLPDGNRKSGHE